jgi:hypothetical protein
MPTPDTTRQPPLSRLIDEYVDSVLCATPEAVGEEDKAAAGRLAESAASSPASLFSIQVIQPTDNALYQGGKYPVPEDLKAAIVASNPSQRIQFVTSQRLNLQMIVDGFLFNKKKGPQATRNGRTINWRCANAACRYSLISYEGRLVRSKADSAHNHAPPRRSRHVM